MIYTRAHIGIPCATVHTAQRVCTNVINQLRIWLKPINAYYIGIHDKNISIHLFISVNENDNAIIKIMG